MRDMPTDGGPFGLAAPQSPYSYPPLPDLLIETRQSRPENGERRDLLHLGIRLVVGRCTIANVPP